MSDMEYSKMLEIPVNTCDVIVKPYKRRKKNVIKDVIEKVNSESGDVIKNEETILPEKTENPALIKRFFRKKGNNSKKKAVKSKSVRYAEKIKKQKPDEPRANSKFDIVSVQVVAVFALVIGIILTNIFWEDSGINNLLKQVFKSGDVKNSAAYTSFSPASPSRTDEVTLDDGVMKVAAGSVYSPCDGEIEKIEEKNGKYTVTIRHSDSFTTTISGIEFAYAQTGEKVYSNVPIGYSSGEMTVVMYNDNAAITSFKLSGDRILWIN